MDSLILLRPQWLMALLPVALTAFWQLSRPRDAGGWEKIMSPPMLQAMTALGAFGTGRSKWHPALLPAAMTALILGMAGPAIQRDDVPALAQSDVAVIALDMSPSVATGPDLQQVQLAAAGLLQGLAGRPVGLILYAGEAFVAAAPTNDPATLGTLISVLDAETMPGQGSKPAAALGLAATLLEDLPRGDVILVSDGGGIDTATLAAADRLGEQSVRLSALVLDNPAAGAPKNATNTLQTVTRNGGTALPASDVSRLATRLAADPATSRDPDLLALQYRDLGPFLAALALIPLLILMRGRL